jgi:hypothetical protein
MLFKKNIKNVKSVKKSKVENPRCVKQKKLKNEKKSLPSLAYNQSKNKN